MMGHYHYEQTLQEPVINNLQRARLTKHVTLIAGGTNLLLSVAQVLIGIIGHSQALVADAMHTFSDLLADGLAYWTAHNTGSAPDSDHPYGHGRFETAATLGIAAILAIVGAGIIWFAVERQFYATILVIPDVLTLYTAAFTVLAKELLYHYTNFVAKRINSDMLRASAWHHRSDAASSIVVLLGVWGTIIGFPYLDAVAAVLVGLMILKISLTLAYTAILELVDTGLDAARLQDIHHTILAVVGVRDIHMLRTRKIGSNAVADVHVLVEPRLSVSEGHMISMAVERRLLEAIPELTDVTVHVDPEDDETAPSCSGLPLRTEVISCLEKAWQDIPQIKTENHRLVLHYLAGKVEVEIYLPLESAPTLAQAKELIISLRQALLPHPNFADVRVYFGEVIAS